MMGDEGAAADEGCGGVRCGIVTVTVTITVTIKNEKIETSRTMQCWR